MSPITSFSGPYSFLSNFSPSPIEWTKGSSIVVPTVEHGFQAMKMTTVDNVQAVLRESSPGRAKRRAKSLPRREDWNKVKDVVMQDLVTRKFLVHKHLAEKLLATGDAVLVEGNTWKDTYWGVCNGVGKNKLGLILMQVRTMLRLNSTFA